MPFGQGARVHDEYLQLWETLWPLGDYLATFGSLLRQVKKILYTPKRASSLVESVNSKLRTVQYIKKQVSQEYLWLLALKHNLEPFAHGKRQGHSPFELLGSDLGIKRLGGFSPDVSAIADFTGAQVVFLRSGPKRVESVSKKVLGYLHPHI